MDNSKRKQSSGWASNVEERVTVQRDVGVAEIRRLDLMCQNFNSSRVLQDSSIGLVSTALILTEVTNCQLKLCRAFDRGFDPIECI